MKKSAGRTFTPEEDRFYRGRLIADYDQLIRDLEEAYARRGDNFLFLISGEQGRLLLAAVKTAREEEVNKQKSAGADNGKEP